MPPKKKTEPSQFKTLVIAEKPSVAADLVKVLPGKFTKEKSHYEGDNHIVSYAVGHLVTIADPGEIDERFKGWSMDVLPIMPDQFTLTSISDSKSQLSALSKLIKRSDVDTIINACDAGREGELIFRYILDYVQKGKVSKKQIKRLWLQSMTKEALQKGFAELRDAAEFYNLSDAAICRSEADWLIGINGSRGLTAHNSKRGGFFLTPCGRVQTPTLALIVKRERERLAFVSRDYWLLKADFQAEAGMYTGTWFDPNFQKGTGDDQSTRLWDLDRTREIQERIKGQKASCSESSKLTQQNCPALYDLTSLQREANSRFGFSAKTTLQLAQALYEKHKLLTYPRTDSRYLPEDYLPTVQNALDQFKDDSSIGAFVKEAKAKNYIRFDKKIFNNAKVSDHHAIIPTGVVPKDTLSEAERKVFQMVLQRSLAIFFPPAKTQVTTRISIIADEHFRTEGKILLDAGWKAVYGKEADQDEDNTLCPITETEQPLLSNSDAEAHQTKPPARYSEASLLSAMEHAGKLIDDEELAEAMKERGLGTPATRAATIEKLLSDKYLQRDGKELIPTRKAFDLIQILDIMKINELSSPELTGEWEYRLGMIEQGNLSRGEFMQGIREMTSHMIRQIKDFREEEHKVPAPFGPLLGQAWFELPGHFESEDSAIKVRKILGGRHMNAEEIAELLQEGKLGPLEGFVSKRGKPFAALLKFDGTKVEFVFEDRDEELQLASTATPLCESFLDQSPVFETSTGVVSKSALDGEKTGLRLGRTMLGKDLGIENLVLLVTGQKTPLIQGFRSSKTKRLFDAYLELDSKGKVKFSFPETRPPRGRAKATPAEEES